MGDEEIGELQYSDKPSWILTLCEPPPKMRKMILLSLDRNSDDSHNCIFYLCLLLRTTINLIIY